MSELAPDPSPIARRGQRLEAIRAREQHIAWLQAQQRLDLAALVQEDRSGMYARYVADELAMVWRRSPRQCRTRVDAAQAFAAFPAVHVLIEDGTWLMDHADAALDVLVGSGLAPEQQQQVLDLVLSRNVHLTPWQVKQAVRTAMVVLFPEHAAEQADRAEQDRDVRAYDEAAGAASLVASGPSHLVAAMMAALDAIARPANPDDARTLAQRRFDTLLALVCGEITPRNWQVHVLTELATLKGENELPAELPGFAPLPAPVAREVAGQAELRRIVVDEHGALVAVEGRVHRPDLSLDAADESLEQTVLDLPDEPMTAELPPPAPLQEPDSEQSPGPDLSPGSASSQQSGPASGPASELTSEPPVSEPQSQPESESVAESVAEPAVREETAAVGDGERAGQGEDADEGPAEDDLRWFAQHRPLEPDELRSSSGARPVYLRRRWSDEAWRRALHRIATDPLKPVLLHSDCYVPPRALKRHLERRDKTCIFPGCPRRAEYCDKDHLIPFPRGATCACNLAAECDHHHHAKHEYFTVERLADGTFRWRSPTGLYADRRPLPMLAAWTYKPR